MMKLQYIHINKEPSYAIKEMGSKNFHRKKGQ